MMDWLCCGNTLTLICISYLLPFLVRCAEYTPPYYIPWKSVPTKKSPVDTEEEKTPNGALDVVGENEPEGVHTHQTEQSHHAEVTSSVSEQDELGAGEIVGIVFAIVALLVIAVVVAVILWRNKKKRESNTYFVADKEDQLVQLRKSSHPRLNGSSPGVETVHVMDYSVSDSLEHRDRSMGTSVTPRTTWEPQDNQEEPQEVEGLLQSTTGQSPVNSDSADPNMSSSVSSSIYTPGEVWTESQVLEMMDEEEVFLAKQYGHLTGDLGADDGKSTQSEVFLDAASHVSSMDLNVKTEHDNTPHSDNIDFGSTETFRSVASHLTSNRKSLTSEEIAFEGML